MSVVHCRSQIRKYLGLLTVDKLFICTKKNNGGGL